MLKSIWCTKKDLDENLQKYGNKVKHISVYETSRNVVDTVNILLVINEEEKPKTLTETVIGNLIPSKKK